MDRENLIQALDASTRPDDTKNATIFLDQLCDDRELNGIPTRNRRIRSTASTSDGADWRNLSVLLSDDVLPRVEEDPEIRDARVKKLMNRWRKAARRAYLTKTDPWSSFHIEEYPILRAKRSRYSAIRKTWTEDYVEVRLHPEPFAHGAMRECYRLKKLSSLATSNDWSFAQNYVAKKYIQEVDRNVLFEDVKLQMDAKLWAEEFNRYSPPKKIDIVQMCVLEIIDLPGEPLYHLEHFIEGKYVKYNSNSGFVSEIARKTPQAFSHFTFERSGHQMIVVDVQGVGDLYTDPQIHTVLGTDYGDGNLGTRGMALFFHSHKCNDICHSLCLTEFDLSDAERKAVEDSTYIVNNAQATQFSREPSSNACSAIMQGMEQDDAMECLRVRTISIRSRNSSSSGGTSRRSSRCSTERSKGVHDDDCVCEDCLAEATANIGIDSFRDVDDYDDDDEEEEDSINRSSHEDSPDEPQRPLRKVAVHNLQVQRSERERKVRDRYDSMGSSIGTSSMGSSRLTRETEKENFWNANRKQSVPAGVLSAIELQQLSEECNRMANHTLILGQIHLDLARYHELGRFLPEEDNFEKKRALGETDDSVDSRESTKKELKYDTSSALYHLDVARRCGVLEAIITVAQMVYGSHHELLKDIGHDENWRHDGADSTTGEDYDREAFAFELMETAAEMGDRGAMLFVAEAFEMGRKMGAGTQPSFPNAILWYQRAVGFSDDDSEGTYRPRYEILARMAEMYQEGGCGLTQDFDRAYNLYNEAAEVAMEAMKGKLANKYYEKAEIDVDTFFETRCAKLPGFTPELLTIACQENLAGPIRQASVIYFKNTVSKYWEANNEDTIPEERRESYVIPDADKEVLKANILEAICISQDSIRPQLCVACQLMIRTDFPDKWNGLLPELEKKLLSSEPAYLLGALLTVYRMSKVYEYKRAQERAPLVHVMKAVLPVLYQHLVQLMPNPSDQAVSIQKLMFKIFYALIQFNLNLDMVPIPSIDAWIEACKEVLVRPVPDEINSIEDEEERAYTVWWKCKKWAAKIIERIYERYSTPGHKEEGYAEFGKHFVQKFSVPFCEVMMKILDQKRTGGFVTDRVTLLALGFLNTSISHSYTWKVLKPHAQEIVTTILFPLLCHSDADESMWEEDVEEYIRFKYDIFEDIHNPVYGAGSLLGSFARRKDVLHPILAFTIQVLSTSTNLREVDGALRMIGELSEQICKNKKYKKDVEKLLDSHVINRLSEPCRFIRARAAWCLKQYSPALFTAKTLNKAIEALVNCLCNPSEEIPAKVESAIALESFLDDQDGSTRIIQPHVSRIIPNVLELCSKTQIEDVVAVMDKFMEEFMDDIVPIALSVAEQMCKLFLTIIKSDVADERTPALMSIINSLSNVVDIMGEHQEIMVRIEESLLEVITYVFETSNIDFYDEVLIVIQSLITFSVSEPMWQVFDKLMEAYTANLGVLQFSDVIPVFHLYITTNTESFLARPERLNALINLCKSVLQNKEEGDENQLYAAKILEIILLQCNTMINEVIPSIMLIALERLGQPFEDGLAELKNMILLVVIAAVHVNSELAFSALKELAPGHPNPFDFLCNQLVEMVDQFGGIHNRKMALFAWCTMMQLPPSVRPSIFSFDSKTVLLCTIKLFNGLQRALKVQAENRKADNEEDSDDDDIDSDDEGHRNIDDDLSDDDDQYDELTLEYLRNLSKENKGDENDEEGTEYDDDETESEQYVCCIDRENGPDIFIIFKNSLEQFKVKDEVLFLQMVNNLSEEQQQELLALDKVCENHVKAEQSKLVRQRGGYSFNAEAEVPGSFNFGN